MSDPPGVPSVLGIEAVEWFAEGGENLTVRVTGRWRRRRPAWSGQPMLVIESSGRRHRFPAMPEPPSLTGAGPGTWRISFAVPATLAPDLGGRTWLQFGAVVVPLPAAVEPLGAGAGPGGAEEGIELAEPDRSSPEPSDAVHSPPSSEVETDSARRRAQEAEESAAQLAVRVQALEEALAAARLQAEQLSASLAERDLTRRAAEQRAHAEQALRRDFARQLAARSNEGERARQALGELAAAEERIRELEAELRDARRRGDEADQIAAAATVARERAERVAAQAGPIRTPLSPGRAPGEAEQDRLRLERGLIERRPNVARRVPAEPHIQSARARMPPEPVPPEPVPLEPIPPEPMSPMPMSQKRTPLERSQADSEGMIAALHRELGRRARSESALRTRLIEAESRLAARVVIERRTASMLVELRQELDRLRAGLERERAARKAAERRAAEFSSDASGQRRRSQQAYEAITALRGALEELRAVAAEEAPEMQAAEPAPAEEALGMQAAEPAPAEEAPEIQAAEPAPAEEAPEMQAPEPAPAEEAAPAEAEPLSALLPPDVPAPESRGRVEPHRFNDARLRLREAIAPVESGAAAGSSAGVPARTATAKPWLEPIFRAMARADADGAGRLLLELLPAQRDAYPDPIAYDLVLGGHRGCVRVTVRDGAPVIRSADGPRSAAEADFQVLGDPAALARLLTVGPLRRRFGRHVARVRGRRDRLAALRSLVVLRLDFRSLHRAGVRLEPELAFTVIARMIDPAWTAGERFTVAYAGEAGSRYLLVRDGRPVQVSDEAPAGRIATTISGPAEALTLALSGDRRESVTVAGDEWPLALLRKWIKRAQSD